MHGSVGAIELLLFDVALYSPWHHESNALSLQHAPADVLYSVGVHRFTGTPQPLEADGTLFRFLV